VAQATEQVSSMHAAFSPHIDDRQSGRRGRRLKLQRPVCLVLVVMLDAHAEDPLKVPGTHNE
jgi:hypothetical protein